jgi:hypothetical protein
MQKRIMAWKQPRVIDVAVRAELCCLQPSDSGRAAEPASLVTESLVESYMTSLLIVVYCSVGN